MLKAILDSMVIAIPLTFLLGIYLSIRLRFFHLRYITLAIKFMAYRKNKNQGLLSSFTALTSVLGGNLGVGNIAGVAVALSTGGPGAVFWMWVMALLGAVIKYAGCFIAIQCRVKQEGTNLFVGGPMYYMRDLLHSPKLAILFCVLTILSALTVGNLAQVNSFAITLSHIESIPAWSIGVTMAILVGLIFLGGMNAFAKVSSLLVPAMALSYFAGCLWVLATHFTHIPDALTLILNAAFSNQAALGGVSGFTVAQAIQVGFNRGLFATDAGVGLESILHSAVTFGGTDKRTAMSQALVSSLAPLIVAILCTLTALVLLCTGVWEGGHWQSTQMCIEAFRKGLNWAHADLFVMVIIFCFGLTTIITWSFCCDKAFEYLLKRPTNIGKYLFILCIPLGALFKVETVWLLGDIAFNGMLLINIFAVALLSKHVIHATRRLDSTRRNIREFLQGEN